MIRRLLLSTFLTALGLFVPASAEAALITQCADGSSPCQLIGTFSWDPPFSNNDPEEPLAIPDLFTLVNSFTADFTDVVLTLNGTDIFSLLDASSGSQTDSGGEILPVVITSAAISFNVLGSQFFAPFPGGTAVTETGVMDIYADIAPVAVPEPASLVMLSLGLGALAARRQRLSRSRAQ